MDLQLLDKLADRALVRGSGEQELPSFQLCKAMSSYRLGRFAESVEWGEKSLMSPGIAVRAKAHAVLAMAYWQLGEKDKARAMLGKGEIIVPDKLPARDDELLGGTWVLWLSARISLNEAKDLIQPAPQTEGNSNQR